MLDCLHQALTVLPGYGAKRAAQFREALSCRTVGALLAFLPRRLQAPPEDRHSGNYEEGEVARFRVRIQRVHLWRARGRSVLRIHFEDLHGRGSALFFNQAYLKKSFLPGQERTFEGLCRTGKQGLELLHPRSISAEEAERRHWRPVYAESESLSGPRIAKAIQTALDWLPTFEDRMPQALRALAQVPELRQAFFLAHRPDGPQDLEIARRRLAWGEALQRHRAQRDKIQVQVASMAVDSKLKTKVMSQLPFALTEDQKQVLNTLQQDLNLGTPMARLLHGEVGSGKTAVAFCLAAFVLHHGGQVALLAPTEILARQHASHFRRWLRGSGFEVGTLLGEESAAERRRSLEQLAEGKTSLVIGTHALYQPAVRFQNLRLVLLDEQHRFGVRQKGALIAKGKHPHVLTMTATPIPRTLAWARYGALQACTLRSRPGGGGEIQTRVHPQSDWPAMARDWRPALEKERRAFVVYPRIDGEGGLLAGYRQLSLESWRGLEIAAIHGRLPGSAIEEAVARFRRGEIRALLGTTVVEVGLDVPGIDWMAILDAQRFGLASLHQLRGRLARGPGAGPGECHIFSEESALERISRLESCLDGFTVAEADLELRGPGALRGTRQHGAGDFRHFDPLRDQDLLDLLEHREVEAWLRTSPPPGNRVAGAESASNGA